MDELEIHYRPAAGLTRNPANARTHSKRQIRQIAESIRMFGFTNPLLIDETGQVLAGHGRLEAAKLLGLKTVPTVRLDHMSAAQKRAYVIADNKLAENAGWDRELLALELQELAEIDADFDVTVTGFETGEIDVLIGALETEPDDDEDMKIPLADASVPAVSRSGDLWLLGNHRLLCGDTRDADALARLMAGAKAQMVFTDPPYNVPIDGHVCGKGSVRHREFAMAVGEMTKAQFTAFLETVLENLARYCIDGAVLDICMDWRHLNELLAAGETIGLSLLNLCVWVKSNAGLGSLYRSQHELVLVFKKGTAAHVNNVELGRHGRWRSNVWSYPGANTLRPERMDELRMHPTVKPLALVKDAILDCSHRNGIVLDGCAGSGTTLIAAEKTGRRGYALEIDGRYVDTAIRRWQALSGEPAIHEESGLPFAEISKLRGPSCDVGREARIDDSTAVASREADDVG